MREFAGKCRNLRENAGICGKMREFAGKCGNLRENAGICGNLREFAGKYGNLRENAGIRRNLRENQGLGVRRAKGTLTPCRQMFETTMNESARGGVLRTDGAERTRARGHRLYACARGVWTSLRSPLGTEQTVV